jgi:hypothetical protein
MNAHRDIIFCEIYRAKKICFLNENDIRFAASKFKNDKIKSKYMVVALKFHR